MKHRGWIAFSGLIWLLMGVFLLYKGLSLIVQACFLPNTLCAYLQTTFGSPATAGKALITSGLLIGFIKGRFVLSKTVRRISFRIQSLPLPIRWTAVYPLPYWMLIGSMMALGMLMKWLPWPIDARGLIDVAVGSALVHGALLYFRAARGDLRVVSSMEK